MESKYIRFLQTTIEDVVEEMMFVREIAELFELQHLTATDRHEGYWQPVGHVTGGRSQDRTSEHKHLLAALENRFAQLERRFAELDHQPSCSKDCWEEWFSNPPELQNRITLLRHEGYWQPVGHVTGGRSQDRTSEHKHLLAALENRFAQLERRFAELDHQPSCSKDCWEEWFSNPPELQNRITLLRSRLDWLEGVFHDEKQWADYFKRLFRDVRDGQDDWKRDTNEPGSLNTGSRDHS
ncbi:hypothetical protein Q5P01_005655 [Channa striata]|uniref:Uncharacterized protein n=1 Tax=Channa striata TaxID=64152 RepID=A0AA88NPE7_CHASR|nr:hypothetical protein Q5P01_005655 [Channa striata]